MITIKEVAKLANVSVATVSRVINGAENVKPETQTAVNDAIAQLGYSPNNLARNLRRSESRKIIVLLNTISNEYYSEIVRGIDTALSGRYSVMICSTFGDVQKENEFCQLLKTKLVDGAIFLTTENTGEVLSESLHGLPCLQACEYDKHFSTPVVTIDNEKAAYDAVTYLIANGHREIAFLGAQDTFSTAKARKIGYTKALTDAGIAVDERLILLDSFSFNSGARSVNKLLANKTLPQALFCASDLVAAGAIKTLYDNNISVPQDISVMGFDNTRVSQIYIPSITTVEQPRFDIGFIAGSNLLKLIKSEKVEERAVLEHRIIERSSVKAVACFENGKD